VKKTVCPSCCGEGTLCRLKKKRLPRGKNCGEETHVWRKKKVLLQEGERRTVPSLISIFGTGKRKMGSPSLSRLRHIGRKGEKRGGEGGASEDVNAQRHW